ncbi:MAG: S16 family serine protease [Candidatus Hadarchaeales archaeon]
MPRKKKFPVEIFAAGIIVGVVLGSGGYFLAQHFPALLAERTSVDLQKWLENSTGATIPIVAVASGAQTFGVVCTLAVKVEPGEGFIYVSPDPMLVGFDFQDADRKATKVAGGLAGYAPDADGVGIKGLDIKFLVVGPGQQVQIEAIDGPSAGAATTLVLLAALENKKIREGAMITGTIEEDGSIGQVGGIFYKAQAAHEAGATLFLVPKGQGMITVYREVKRRVGPWTFVSYQPELIDLNQYSQEQGWGVQIVEVSNIQEAAALMLE